MSKGFLLFLSWAPLASAQATSLQQQILSAFRAGNHSVTIPSGTYRIPVRLQLDGLHDFEIAADKATLLFEDVRNGGIQFSNCDNVHFHGATLAYATPPFSQGVIRSVAADGSSVDVQIEAGFPTNLDDPHYFSPQLMGHLFNRTTRSWKRNVAGDVNGTRTQRLGLDTFRVFTQSTGGAEAGDLIAFRSGVGNHMVEVRSSSRMAFERLTILNSPMFGISELSGTALGRNRYLSIIVGRGPRPPGAATEPLLSTNADAFHSAQSRRGPDIEDCRFEWMGDDGIAIHGFYSAVMESAGNTLVVSSPYDWIGANFAGGDHLQLVDAAGRPAGEAQVTGVARLPGYRNTRKSAHSTRQDFTAGPYFRITVDRVLHAGFDDWAGNPDASGVGYVIRGNSIRNHRARGMILKAGNGTVEGNVIEGSTMAAIRIGPEFYWAEAGYPRNVVIRDNRIADVAYSSGHTSAIVVGADQGAAPAGAFQNIVIEGNHVQNARPVVADSDGGFSGTQGAHGWSYGYFPAGTNHFKPLPAFDPQRKQWQHTRFGPPWTLEGANSTAHPNGANNGSEEWAVRRWTSTISGEARVSGHLAKIDASANSPGVYGRLYWNGRLIYEHFLAGTDAEGVDYSVPVKLKTGDTLDFVVAPKGADISDTTRFSATISVTK